MKTRLLAICSIFALLFLAGAGNMFAQTAATGALTGTITDASGAVIPNATVTLTSADTGQARVDQTSADGTYRFLLLAPGNYKFEVKANGFKSIQVPSVAIAVTETPVLNRSLEVGAQSEEVTVQENVEAIQTATSALGTVVESKTVTDLPLTTRNYTNLLGLSAGANANVPNASAFGRGTMEIAVNGASTAQNTFLMDGVNIVNAASSGVNTEGGTYATFGIPNPDTLAEFKIQTSLYDAGYGRNPGANVNVITKSGTNQWHGTAFEFLRNTALNANDFFRNRTCGLTPALCAASGGAKLALNQNQFGGVIGGPIKKDKLFIFSSYQQTNQKNGFASTGYTNVNLPAIPTGARNTGAFQAALGAAFCKSATSVGGTQVACDGSNINPIALNMLNAVSATGAYMMPGSSTGATQNVSYSQPAIDHEYQGMLNLDYLLNAKNTIASRYFRSVEPQYQPIGNNLPGVQINDPFGYHDGVLKLTTIVSASMVNELRGSIQRTTTLPYETVPSSWNASNLYPSLGLASNCNLLGCTLPYAPVVSLTGLYTVGGSAASDETVTNLQYQMADQISWTHGIHSVRIGVEMERVKWNWIYFGLSRGIEAFQTFQDFLIGLPGACGTASPTCNGGTGSNILNTTNFDVKTGPGGIIHTYLMRNASTFAQDDIKVNQRLTLNLGLRWEYDGAVSDKYGNLVNMWASGLTNVPSTTQSPTPGQYLLPTGGSYSGWMVPSNYSISTYGTPPAGVLSTGHNIATQNGPPLNNFAPRIGFAWRPSDSNKFVVRGGAGFFYDRVPGNTIIHAVEQSPPYAITLDQSGVGNSFSSEIAPFQNIPAGTFPIRWVNFNNTTPYSESSGITQTSEFQKFVTPIVYSWNINFQYQLAPTWTLEIGYVGSRGLHQAETTHIINEASVATPTNPINGLTVSTVNNAPLRVPYLGLSATGAQYAMSDMDYKATNFQATLRKQLSHGLTLQAAYSFTRAFSTASQGGAQNSGDPLNSQQQYGLNTGYRPQRLVINYSYAIPGNNVKGMLGHLTSGWSLSGVTTIQDGDPMNCTDNRGGSIFGLSGSGTVLSRCQTASGVTYAQGLNTGGVKSDLGGASGGCGYFACTNPAQGGLGTTSASGFTGFTTIPNYPGTNGTGWGSSGVGIVLGPGQFNWDATLMKATRVGGIHENAQLQFRVEFYNIWNHAQFSNPNMAFNSAAFGQITSTAVNPRLIQLALKYAF